MRPANDPQEWANKRKAAMERAKQLKAERKNGVQDSSELTFAPQVNKRPSFLNRKDSTDSLDQLTGSRDPNDIFEQPLAAARKSSAPIQEPPSPGSDALGRELKSFGHAPPEKHRTGGGGRAGEIPTNEGSSQRGQASTGDSPCKSKFLQQYEQSVTDTRSSKAQAQQEADEIFMSNLRSDPKESGGKPGWNDDTASSGFAPLKSMSAKNRRPVPNHGREGEDPPLPASAGKIVPTSSALRRTGSHQRLRVQAGANIESEDVSLDALHSGSAYSTPTARGLLRRDSSSISSNGANAGKDGGVSESQLIVPDGARSKLSLLKKKMSGSRRSNSMSSTAELREMGENNVENSSGSDRGGYIQQQQAPQQRSGYGYGDGVARDTVRERRGARADGNVMAGSSNSLRQSRNSIATDRVDYNSDLGAGSFGGGGVDGRGEGIREGRRSREREKENDRSNHDNMQTHPQHQPQQQQSRGRRNRVDDQQHYEQQQPPPSDGVAGSRGGSFGGFDGAGDMGMDMDVAAGPQKQCPDCGRKFNPIPFEKHVRICSKVFLQKRKVFDSTKMRVADNPEMAKMLADAKKRERLEARQAAKGIGGAARKGGGAAAAGGGGGGFSSKSAAAPAVMAHENAPIGGGETKAEKWRRESEAFRAAMRGARKVSKAIESGAPLPVPVASAPDPSLVPCPHCSRRFNQKAAERHIPQCQNIKARPTMLKKGAGVGGGIAGTPANGANGDSASAKPKPKRGRRI